MNKKVKLLIITQKVDKNDDILGFFHRWLIEFAKHFEQITVICLYKGEYDLPSNVKVLSIGKEEYFREEVNSQWNEKGVSYLFHKGGRRFDLEEKISSKIKYTYRFYKYIWRERKNYDTVFVHMNPVYIVLGGLFWRLWRKKIGLWYAHKHISLSLRIAEKFSNIIFTSTTSGFRLKSKKVHIIGQGIDTDKFKAKSQKFKVSDKFNIITVGRISPIKNYETLIDAVDILVKDNIQVTVKIIGDIGLLGQEKYFSKLKQIVEENKLERIIFFIGAIPNKDIIKYLQESDMFVNTSNTGSLDKAVLEAMAAELPILTCNEALQGVLGNLSGLLMFPKGDSQYLAGKIKFIANMNNSDKINLGRNLRKIVKENHNLTNFVNKIANILK